MFTCQCPATNAISTIPAETCNETFGQIQKIIFQRLLKDDGTKNGISASPTASASWTAYFVESPTDKGTKMTISPYVEEPNEHGGDARTYGGGNTTVDGIERITGSNTVNFSGRFNDKPQSLITPMKEYMCDSLAGNLGVYLVNGKGQIQGVKEVSGGTTTWRPIPIRKLFVSDLIHGGLESPDYNTISWGYIPGYSDKLGILTLADGNALDFYTQASQ